ncbi:hypothetical protein [Paraburkholderia youngii]|uniref:hypothetical protein n=1 Tax=Paraburkholderia youngii TaxID=2782701 RepID=UPI003D1E2C0E
MPGEACAISTAAPARDARIDMTPRWPVMKCSPSRTMIDVQGTALPSHASA